MVQTPRVGKSMRAYDRKKEITSPTLEQLMSHPNAGLWQREAIRNGATTQKEIVEYMRRKYNERRR